MILKFVKKIAQKRNIDFLEVYIIFLVDKVLGVDFDFSVKKLFNDLDENEYKLLKEFFEHIEIYSPKEIVSYIDDYDKAAQILVMFFAPFLPQEVLFSKDAEKIKEALNVYPKPIKEVVLKTLETLSMVKLLKEEDKKTVIEEVLHTISLLSQLLKEMNVAK
jgi:hypothetical protein